MDQLGGLMTKHNYSPSLIFNFDETFLHPGKSQLKVLVRSKGNRPTVKMLAKGEHITFGVCIAADGGRVAPVLVLPLKTLPELPTSLLHFFTITGQENGWITSDIWSKWIKEIFVQYVEERRKKLNLKDARALLV